MVIFNHAICCAQAFGFIESMRFCLKNPNVCAESIYGGETEGLMPVQRHTIGIFLLTLAVGEPVLAQESNTANVAVEPTSQTVVDEAPFATSRAAGMAGAISPFADDIDAAIHNPAGLGGLRWGKTKAPFIRKVYFPYVSVGTNPDSTELTGKLGTMARERPQTGLSKAATTDESTEADQAFTEAAQGQRQYVRASIVPLGLVLGKMMLVPFTDHQIAAVSQGPDAALIDLRIRSLSGLGGGLSMTDAQERVALGYFAYTGVRRETIGAFSFEDFSDRERRREALAANSRTYTGLSHNLGANFRLGKQWTPTLAVALKNAGDTLWKADGGDQLKIYQDLTVGLGLMPLSGKSHGCNLVFEAYRLLHDEVSLQKKFRLGAEFNFWGYGSYAGVGLRAGYSDDGGAAGLSLNLGLIGAEAAIHSVDIGAGNEKVIEQRYLGSIFVNVAEF